MQNREVRYLTINFDKNQTFEFDDLKVKKNNFELVNPKINFKLFNLKYREKSLFNLKYNI